MDSPIGDFLCPEGFRGPRGVRALVRESATVVETVRYLRASGQARRSRVRAPYAGSGRIGPVDPVMLVPGFMAGDGTLRLMARALRAEGFRTYRSDIRVNVGCTQQAGERLERRLETIAERRERKVTIVGHSLGGMLARGVAGRRPDLVEGIVTLGSPMLAPGAVHAMLAWDVELLVRLTRAGFGGLMSADCVAGACARQSSYDMHLPLPAEMGHVNVYSRRDGVVDWRSCIDPAGRAVEVRSSHCGMALDPAVIAEVVAALRDQQVSRAIRQAPPSASEAVLRVART